MTERDIGAVVDLIHEAMNPLEARQAKSTFNFHFTCQKHGLDDGRSYFVLDDDAGIQAVVGLHHYHWGPAQNVWLAWFAVSPYRHGSGLGERLLEAVRARARQQGYSKLFIETYSTPEFGRARAFYRRQGFAEVGHVRSYLADGGDMVVFAQELANDT